MKASSAATWLVVGLAIGLVAACGAWESVDAYIQRVEDHLVPEHVEEWHVAGGLTTEDEESMPQLRSNFLNNLVATWDHDSSRLATLTQPSHFIRLEDQPAAEPARDMANLDSVVCWERCITRLLNGPWIHNMWRGANTHWSLDNLFTPYYVHYNGVTRIGRPSLGLCIPMVAENIESEVGMFPTWERHNLAHDRVMGYITMYVGRNNRGAVREPVPRIIARGYLGAPDMVEETGHWEECMHLCNNPWCCNPLHLHWGSHRENCMYPPTATVYGEEA